MTIVKKISASLAAGALAIGMAGGTLSTAYAEEPGNATISNSQSSKQAFLNIHEANAHGFSAEIENGSAVIKEDGSVHLLDSDGEVAVLSSHIHLNDGTEREVSYSLSGNSIVAKYDSPIAEDAVKLQSPFRDNVECALSAVGAAGAFIGGVGAALTAPLTFGGGLVVGGAGIAAGAAGANAAYQCFGKQQ